MVSPIISFGADSDSPQNTDMLNILQTVEIPEAEYLNTEEVEAVEETNSLPDESAIALAAATVAETTDIGWLYNSSGAWIKSQATVPTE